MKSAICRSTGLVIACRCPLQIWLEVFRFSRRRNLETALEAAGDPLVSKPKTWAVCRGLAHQDRRSGGGIRLHPIANYVSLSVEVVGGKVVRLISGIDDHQIRMVIGGSPIRGWVVGGVLAHQNVIVQIEVKGKIAAPLSLASTAFTNPIPSEEVERFPIRSGRGLLGSTSYRNEEQKHEQVQPHMTQSFTKERSVSDLT